MNRATTGVLAIFCLCVTAASSPANSAQFGRSLYSPTDTTSPSAFSPQKLSEHALRMLNTRYTLMNKLVQRKTEKMLLAMRRKEMALQRQIQGKDSLKARVLFSQSQTNYERLLANIKSTSNAPGTAINAMPLRQYIPGIDSMQTALRFLGQTTVQTEVLGLLPSQQQEVRSACQELMQLQAKLQQANEIQSFIRQREQDLKDQLMNSGVAKQLRAINQEAYYYQAQLGQYKDMLNDPNKMAQSVLGVVRQLPAFQKFWQQNSYFSHMFPTPPPGVA